MTNKKLAETLTGIARPSWLRSVLHEQPQQKGAPPPEEAPPEEAPPEEAPPEEQAPPEDAPPEEAPPEAGAPPDQQPPPDQQQQPPDAQPPPQEPAPQEPPVGGNQADEQPPPDAKPFMNNGKDDLNVDGTPKTSPNRYRQPGPGDQEAIRRFLKKNSKATDDDLHSFMRTLGIDPAQGEKTVMKLARTAREEAVSTAVRGLVGLFIDEDVEQLSERDHASKAVNKPWRTPEGPKKFAVLGSEGGEKRLVRFGDPNMEIKRDSPERRKNFRARHGCNTPGPKTKAKYWACKTWEKNKKVSDVVESTVNLFIQERKDLVPGGKGDKLDEKDVDQHELAMGIKVELEHTKSKALAKEIALDHLKEDPKYYTKLRKIHKESEGPENAWRNQKYGGSIGDEPARFWNVGKLHDYAVQNHPVKRVPVSRLAHLLKAGSGVRAKEPFGSAAFKARADKAVMYPILLASTVNGLDVIDGTHRLQKAIDNGVTHIDARVIPWDKLPESALTTPLSHNEAVDGGRQIITDDAPEPGNIAPEESVTLSQRDPRTGEKQNSCSVVIPLPADLARQFPKMIGQRDCTNTVPHVTVLHVGDISPAEYTGMINVVQKVVTNYQPFFMDMHGADVFDDNKDHDVLYAVANSRTFRAFADGVYPTLHVLHAELRKALEDAGIDVKHNYGKNKGSNGAYAERYMPHATIAYIPKNEQCLVRPPSGSWFVLDVECWGWERVQLPLGKLAFDQPAFRR